MNEVMPVNAVEFLRNVYNSQVKNERGERYE